MDVYIQQNNTNIPIDNLMPPLEHTVDINHQVAAFTPISLAEMDSVKLMNRVDTKFLIGIYQLNVLLDKALEHYRIVEIDGVRITPYSTIYFDTEDAQMYMMHHNGKLNRYKIRMRSYIDSGISFLEIKNKSNKGRTSKKRIGITPAQFEQMNLEQNEHEFIHKIFNQHFSLVPQLQILFHRITLVDKNLTERVTLDTRLSFQNIADGECHSAEGLVIVEMKQDGANSSYFKKYLDELRINAASMSKYCMGMVMVNPNFKANRFKNKLRKINKITNTNHDSN